MFRMSSESDLSIFDQPLTFLISDLIFLQFCTTKTPNVFKTNKSSAPLNATLIKAVLAVTGVRDDARFLARFAFGIPSPRITALGLNRCPEFASCEAFEFPKLVARFEAECKKVGGKNGPVLGPGKARYTPAAGAVKRPSTSATGGPASKRGGRGGSTSTGGRGGWARQ